LFGSGVTVAVGDGVEDIEQFEVADKMGAVAVDDTAEAMISARGIHGAAKAALARNIDRMAEKYIVDDFQ
jgi:succinyl-CoA synthetase alpha subunit